MNKSILWVAACLLLASCGLDDHTSNTKYTIYGTFDNVSNSQYASYFKKDSTYAQSFFGIDETCYLTSSIDKTTEEFQGGFKLSLKRGKLDADGAVTPFASAGQGGGQNGSSAYTVWYQNPDASKMPEYAIGFNFPGNASVLCSLLGICVVNSAAVEEFYNSGQAQEGDFLKIVATGYVNDSARESLEYYLLDLRDGKSEIVTQWKAWDWSGIKSNVNAVKLQLVSSRPEVPPYFCMDTFCVRVEIQY